MAITLTSAKLLLVEGADEANFIRALLHLADRDDVQVLGYGGKNSLNVQFSAIMRTPGFDQIDWLGIAQDADHDAATAFQRVRDVLTRNGLAAPARSWRIQPGNPATVVLIWPDGTRQGDLEELVWDAVMQTTPDIATCVTAYFQCLGIVPPQSPSAKARVHAYLASLAPPDHRLGTAAQARLLPLSSAVFDRFRSLLP
ncbi:MAG: DUF3226 domain-containing protein [Chloroflexota bacterium]